MKICMKKARQREALRKEVLLSGLVFSEKENKGL